MSGEKPFFPDFVVVRKKGKGYAVDILEPHDDILSTFPLVPAETKAAALAAFQTAG